MQIQKRRVLWLPSAVLYSYPTDIYRNGSFALLLVGRIAEAGYVTLSLSSLLWTVEYSPASHFAHDQMMSVCAGRVVLLPVPWVLVGQ